MKITLHAMIEEVNYELEMRSQVYPRLIARGRMRRGEAELHIARMQAVLRTLHWLNDMLDAHGRKNLPDIITQINGGQRHD